ncbi:hypothetical protein CYY_008358 [Polysphondylium violaceum]|uniref:FNIP repeat-containing protein n=1 Tax=Polysphondylium violaceum TaxID=133409 RepID=A0A8J4UQ78_9MYCE|nr:hypothetical protein CYY_008358 [Polysphondylium violaceum]
MTEPFYLIYRNQYIRQLIRNLVCQDVSIRVDEEYLEENHQYLALFHNKHKIDYNIFICFKGNAGDYLDINNSNRDLINVVELSINDDDFDLSEIHDGVRKLSLTTENNDTSVTGKLPPSITWLRLTDDIHDDHQPSYTQQILSNLPSSLQKLELNIPRESITIPCIMPESLTDILTDGLLYYDVMKWFVVPSNRVYKSCEIYIDSVESFEWLLANKWIPKVRITRSGSNMMAGRYQLPSHVTNVEVYGIIEDQSFFPQTLEALSCGYGTPISHLAHLKVLRIGGDYPINLERGVLPSTLQELRLDYNHPLESLCANVLPLSLTELYLGVFNQPLNAFVLPSKLKTLYMQNFRQPILPPNSLPVSLINLSIGGFNGSFDQYQPLDNLKKQQVNSLNPSLATLLTNVKKLYLLVFNKGGNGDPSGCLYNTSIRSLYLEFICEKALYPNTFPLTLKYLTLVNANLESDDIIPSGCTLLNK